MIENVVEKKKDCKYEKPTPKSLIFLRKVYFSIPKYIPQNYSFQHFYI